jgi:hypothetical protein
MLHLLYAHARYISYTHLSAVILLSASERLGVLPCAGGYASVRFDAMENIQFSYLQVPLN